jgi:hypothetical protein
MRANDIDLQLRQVGFGDPLLGELAEAGIDAIDRRPFADQFADGRGAAGDRLPRLVTELGGDRPRQYGADILERERPVADGQCHAILIG